MPALEHDLAKAIRDNSDAMKDQGSAATAFQEKMSQLPKAGQQFVRFLVGLKPRLDALRETAASGFFPGAEKGLKGVLRNFGVFRGIVDGTSKALGRLASKAGSKLGSEMWGKDLGRLGKLNERIIGRLGDSTLNLADAFRNVLVSAEPFLDWLSKGTEKFSEWLSTESSAARESGKLAEFFDRTRETMERIWPILKGVGGSLLNIADAARPLGNEILDALGHAAEGWRKWTDSTKGKNVLKQHFSETKPAIFEMGRLIRDASKAFFELGKQRGVAQLLRLVRTELIPAVRDMVGGATGWAAHFIKEFGQLRKDGVPTFDAFVQTLANHAGQASVKIAKALVNGFLHASVLGKLFIGGWLLARFGGLKALARLGADMGGALGKRLFKAAAKWIAGTEAGSGLLSWFQDATGPTGKLGKAAGVGGTRVGTIFGRGLALGAAASLAAAAPFIVETIRSQIKKPLEDVKEEVFGSDIGGAINDATNFIGKNAPVAGAAGVVLKGIFSDKGPLEVPAPKTDKAIGAMRELRKRGGEELSGFRRKIAAELGLVPGMAESSGRGALRQMLPRLDTLKTQGGQKGDAFAARLGASFGNLTSTATTAMDTLGFNVREMLRVLGGKPPRFNLKKALASLPELKPMGPTTAPVDRQRGGFVPAFATGGLAAEVPGHSTGDRHTLSLNGRPVAKVESKEGIFVGNRNLMGALDKANAEHPRFQEGGLLSGPIQKLRRGGLAEPKLEGPTGALKGLGRAAIHKVFEGAKDYLAKKRPMASGAGGPVPPGTVRDWLTEALKATGHFSPANLSALYGRTMQESGGNPRAVNNWDSNAAAGHPSQGLLQTIPETFNAYKMKGHGDILNPVDNAIAAINYMFARYGHIVGPSSSGYMRGGLVKLATGGLLGRGSGIQKLLKRAAGGMVDVPGDGGSGVVNPSIVDLVSAYCKRFDTDVNYGYDPSGHVSPGHLVTGTATDVSPTDGNWDGAFAKGLETLTGMGFEVGYDGSIPGTENWPNHGRGNHAHIEWVGNGTAGDSRQRLREYMGGVGTSATAETGPVAKPKEQIPAVYKGAKTGDLNLGPMPKDLGAVKNAIEKWQGEVGVYRKAKRHAEKSGKPGVAQAIGRNLSAIEDRLNGLRQARSRLRLQKAKKALSKRLKGRAGQIAGYEQMIEGSERDYGSAAQYAEQVVALEPQSPEISPQVKGESDKAYDDRREAAEKDYVRRYTAHVDGPERSAYGTVLGKAADWRNTILRAELFGFGDKQPSVARMQTGWEGEARTATHEIEQIKAFAAAVKERIAAYRKGHPKEAFPDWLKEQIKKRDSDRDQLPILQTRNTQLREAIGSAREKFFPGGKNRLTPPTLPLPGSGSFEEALTNVQGIHLLPDQHELLSASALAPPRVAGRFGGAIWDVQTTIEELGLKISQATNSLGGPSSDEGEDSSERASLAEELLRQRNTRDVVGEVAFKVFRDFEKTYSLRDLPKFHTGGVVPGPPNREIIAKLRGHEAIFTPEQMNALGSAASPVAGAVVIEQIVIHEDGTATAKVDGQELRAAVRDVVRQEPALRLR